MHDSAHNHLTFADVSAGDELPKLVHDVSATTVILGALASRDWRPMHHDRDFAQQRNGTRDIFMNTPNQAAWLERYITDWAGPKARIGRYRFRMGDPVCPGDRMSFTGRVQSTDIDDLGCGWVALEVALVVANVAKTRFTARVALPVDAQDNPWARDAAQWRP